MKADLAIWLSELLAEHENCKIEWRIIKKYADDWVTATEIEGTKKL